LNTSFVLEANQNGEPSSLGEPLTEAEIVDLRHLLMKALLYAGSSGQQKLANHLSETVDYVTGTKRAD